MFSQNISVHKGLMTLEYHTFTSLRSRTIIGLGLNPNTLNVETR